MIYDSFVRIRGKHLGEKVAIVAPGPSLKNLDSLEPFTAAFFVGDSHLRTRLRARTNYYVRANSESPRLDSLTDMKPLLEGGFELFIASSVMESKTPVRELAGGVALNITLFDQRHFGGEDCYKPTMCCTNKIQPTLQEYLAQVVGWDHHYSQGPTVLLHALAIALISNPNSISIFGAGIPLKQTDYTYLHDVRVEESSFRSIVQKISFRTLRNLIRNPRVLRFRLAGLILGVDAPSILAEDIVELIADLQYISDVSTQLGVSLNNATPISTLARIHGISATEKMDSD